MRAITDVPRAARPVESAWRSLQATHGTGDVFDQAAITHLPDIAQRWVTNAIEEGTPLARSVQLTMRGTILLRSWRAFTAEQLLAPNRGFIWSATTRMVGLPVSGYDRFTDGEGEMRWRLSGVIPVMSVRGADVTRSAAGRMVGESVLVPTAFDQASWTQVTGESVDMTWALPGGESETATVKVSTAGEPTQLSMYRWGNPFARGYRRYRFVVDLGEQRTFDGVTIPTHLQARWEDPDEGTRLDFYRADITNAIYR